MPLTLVYTDTTSVPVEVEGITPDRLRGKSPAEIERLEIYHGNRKVSLAELFTVSGEPGDGRIDFEGELGGVHFIGCGLTGGEIHVHGNAGRHLGGQMSGGTIRVEGNAGDWVGAEMSGGLIDVSGHAGHLVGAAYRGSKRGMTDGTILIGGDAGDENGVAMRRGMVAVRGSCGDAAGFNMIAGSILVFGRCGVPVGAGMRRGTIGILGPRPPRLLPTFRRGRGLPAFVFPPDLRRTGPTGFPGRRWTDPWRSFALSWGSHRPGQGRGLDARGIMTRDYLKIAGGTVYDPANGIDGEVRDIWIAEGSIVETPDDPGIRPARAIDAAGMVVMPGGVDMHCHIVGPKVNHGRKLSPDHNRFLVLPRAIRSPTADADSGTMGSVPSTFATGYKYAGMGYTTAFDAAIPPLFARHAHQEFDDTPCIDKGFFTLMGNNHYVMRSIQNGEYEKLRAFVGWLLGSAKGYAVKLVNPGGVEVWKQRQAGNVKDLDTPVDHFGVTPRQIIRSMAQVVDELRLPHSVHIHTNNLGLPGNWTTTLETMKLLEGHRGHLTHIQFHSYGRRATRTRRLSARTSARWPSM